MPTQIEVRFVELVMVVAGHGVVFGYTLVVALGDGDGGRHGGREEGWNPHKKRWLPVAREERAAQANGQRGAEGRREEERPSCQIFCLFTCPVLLSPSCQVPSPTFAGPITKYSQPSELGNLTTPSYQRRPWGKIQIVLFRFVD